MSRTLVCGDIHGNYRALIQCLERSNFDYENDTLIQLGDVADGWSEVSECVDKLLEIKNLISIRGNHDVWVYDWLKLGVQPIIWTQQGGKATLHSYMKTQRFIDKDHKDFWFNQKDWYIDNKNRLFIHAGWDYTDRNGFEHGASLKVNAGSIAKECHWDRELYYGARSGSVKNKDGIATGFRALEQFNEVYIGHTATGSHLPENYLNLWNLDSGSGWYGKLTIMDIDNKEYWQSDFATLLYPEEKGRG